MSNPGRAEGLSEDPYFAHMQAVSRLESAPPNGTPTDDEDNHDYGRFPTDEDSGQEAFDGRHRETDISEHAKRVQRAVKRLNRKFER